MNKNYGNKSQDISETDAHDFAQSSKLFLYPDTKHYW